MEILKLSSNNKAEVISKAIEVLSQGGIVIYPTETCYGIAVDPTNKDAVSKLLSYKTFRGDKPISIAVNNQEMAEKYVTLNATAKHLYKEYLPGPFTIVSKGKGNVAVGVESDIKTLGIRMPKYNFILELISEFKKPITATSANVSYKKTPYEVNDILNNTSEKQQGLIGLIIDAGKLPKNDPSTVIDTTLDDVNILRQGDIVIKEKQKLVTKSEDETREFGKRLVAGLIKEKEIRPIIIAMQGELGTGKTQMTKGIAKEIGIEQEVISPTFIICREYKDCKYFEKLHHIDTYKLMDADEIYEMGFENMIKEKNLVIVEWAEKISKVIKENSDKARIVWINMYHKDENERIIEYGEYKNEN
jgi:L-threonylcarbamoyladenylate synthase